MKTTLVTGANKGIGFEVAKQLLQNNVFVYLGSRNLENGQQAVDELKSAGFNNVEAIELDVTNDQSVKEARKTIGEKTSVLDILINNAGISGGQPQTSLSATMQQFHDAYETNVFGVVRVTQAFIDLMQKSDQPRIVNVSSGQGSITLASDPTSAYYNFKGAVYQSSKSAVNMYTVVLAFDLKDTLFKVNLVSPGFTKTDFNGNRGTGTVEDAGKRILKYAFIGQDGPTGKFFCEETNPLTGEIPW
ncbi:SDR family oxidoreductase [Mariniflexile jejuense]|uniref:SDR family oxidoreductase n=1 Tax=Mariniflexile jejuense TaxID=1173582 RepID=A0ABW3JPA2_9FLAO